MNKITINNDDLKKREISLIDIILIKIVLNKEEKLFNTMKKSYNVKHILYNLESKQYVKIIDIENIDGIVLRKKAIELFPKDKNTENIKDIITYLNKKLNKKKGFSLVSSSNRKFVLGRLNEGYTVSDLKAVIDVKFSQWYGTQNEKFLRPETLFNSTKFQGYFVESQKNISDFDRVTAM